MRVIEILLPKGTQDDRSLPPQTAIRVDMLQKRMNSYVDKILSPGTTTAGKEFLKSKLRDDYYELKDLLKPHGIDALAEEPVPTPPPPPQQYEVYDRQTNARVGGPYQDKNRARRRRDKLDLDYGAYRYGVRPYGSTGHGVAEAIDWKGNVSGTEQSANTDHTIEEAETYLKQNYTFHKKYTISRAEPGFRANKDPSVFAKSIEHTNNVDSLIDYLKLQSNPFLQGSAQPSDSVGYSWSVHENKETGVAVLYYQDRGMGSDSVLVGTKDKATLNSVSSMLAEFGLTKSADEIKQRRDQKAQSRAGILDKKGLKVGSKIAIAGGEGEVVGITPGGKLKVKILTSTYEPNINAVVTVSPGSISKKNIISEAVRKLPLSDDDFELVKQLMERPIPAVIAPIYIGEVIDDDELNDQIRSLEETEPGRDVRPLVVEWIKRVMPDQLGRFGQEVADENQKRGILSPIHGYDPKQNKSIFNSSMLGNAYGRIN